MKSPVCAETVLFLRSLKVHFSSNILVGKHDNLPFVVENISKVRFKMNRTYQISIHSSSSFNTRTPRTQKTHLESILIKQLHSSCRNHQQRLFWKKPMSSRSTNTEILKPGSGTQVPWNVGHFVLFDPYSTRCSMLPTI